MARKKEAKKRKSYPAGQEDQDPGMDNLFLFLYGVTRFAEMKRVYNFKLQSQYATKFFDNYEKKIRECQKEMSYISTKDVKGHTYYYLRPPCGQYKYLGKDDPAPLLKKRIHHFQQKINDKKREYQKKYIDDIKLLEQFIYSHFKGHMLVRPQFIYALKQRQLWKDYEFIKLSRIDQAARPKNG